MLTEMSILVNYNQDVQIIVETNSSNYINGKVFFQLDNNDSLYLVVFFSKNVNLT